MRILVVSFVFPPYNIIGAVRVGKTAKYLTRLGHDVRVIAAANLDLDPSLALEIPEENVVYAKWTDVDAPFRMVLAARNRLGAHLRFRREHGANGKNSRLSHPKEFNSEGPLSEPRTLAWRLRLLYTDIVHFPDAAAGWRRSAVRAGEALARAWHPDVILASGAPWTSLVVGRDLSARLDVPWVADLRDLWSENHTTFVSEWRKRSLDRWYEQRVLRTAAALVTVSEPLAEVLRARYGHKPIDVVLNGFDVDDYIQSANRTHSSRESSGAARVLRLVYTGEINRDMLPLLEGIRLLGDDARSLRLEIVGAQSHNVRARYGDVIRKSRLDDVVEWHPPVSHAQSSRLQENADILVLLLHDSPKDAGVYTGKLLEYVGARRPILVAGASSGVAAELVVGRGLGYAEASPQGIANRLRGWLQEARLTGRVAAPIDAHIDDLSRESQTMVFAKVLERVRRA